MRQKLAYQIGREMGTWEWIRCKFIRGRTGLLVLEVYPIVFFMLANNVKLYRVYM